MERSCPSPQASEDTYKAFLAEHTLRLNFGKCYLIFSMELITNFNDYLILTCYTTVSEKSRTLDPAAGVDSICHSCRFYIQLVAQCKHAFIAHCTVLYLFRFTCRIPVVCNRIEIG